MAQKMATLVRTARSLPTRACGRSPCNAVATGRAAKPSVIAMMDSPAYNHCQHDSVCSLEEGCSASNEGGDGGNGNGGGGDGCPAHTSDNGDGGCSCDRGYQVNDAGDACERGGH